jgi:hypothetical protein
MGDGLLKSVYPVPKPLELPREEGVLSGQMAGLEVGATIEEQKSREG